MHIDSNSVHTDAISSMVLSAQYKEVHYDYHATPCYSVLKIQTDSNLITRVPIDLVCTVDVSGSMVGSEIEMVKKSLLFLLTILNADDRLAIVLFNARATRLFDLSKVDSQFKETAIKLIQGIKAGGGTDVEAGIRAGNQIFAFQDSKDTIRAHIVFTDGESYSGYTENHKIISETTNYRIQNKIENVPLHTLGFGSQYNAKLLSDISNACSGVFRHIANTNQITSAFEDCITGFVNVVATDVIVSIESLSKNVSISKLYFTFKDVVETASGVQGKIDNLIKDEEKVLAFCVLLDRTTKGETSSIRATVMYTCDDVRYKRESIFNILRSDQDVVSEDDTVYRFSIMKSKNDSTEALKAAYKKAEEGSLDEGINIIMKSIESITSSPCANDPSIATLITDMLSVVQDMKSQHQFSLHGSKKLLSIISSGKAGPAEQSGSDTQNTPTDIESPNDKYVETKTTFEPSNRRAKNKM